ncbi:PRKR-interacting protein 1 homolog [Pieris napi]|uniref:PRKR-interacting protein 1 homolog n=1 Tax=Pieris napi TaxID=78633 RepID=UPI001FBB09EE|nr:PRKR-interacting protein 1 homolog [Pieris napi]
MDVKDGDKEEKKPIVVKDATDLQRLRLEKLMKNPEKPVLIPERRKDKSLAPPPDFVRNVMGSSAGAGSGEFHVYRHLRRKEYARQKFIQEKSEKEKLDDAYHNRIEENKRKAEERTAKKRAKRLKRKQKTKIKATQPKTNIADNKSSQSNSDSNNSEEELGLDSKQKTDNTTEPNINNVKSDCESGNDHSL